MLMSSLFVIGIKPADVEYKKKAKAYKACVEAGVEPPEELCEYFEWKVPDPQGMEVDISHALTERNVEMQDGFDIDLNKLPEDVKFLKVYYLY